MWTISADQDSTFAHLIHDTRSRCRCRLRRTHQLDADKQPRATHVADDLVSLLQLTQASKQPLTNLERVSLQVFLLHNLQHLQSDRTRNVVASESAEELHAVRERAGDCSRRDHRTDRMPVANWFTKHDDVGHDAVFLKRPEVRADASIPCLHLFGTAKPP